ncbi:MAG: DUF2066 domain-containing protein [Pseudohongiellaceae bacterium]|nr:DUF2066 domain-containing protein [Pseudohongiellaceae bacterium]
MKNFSFIILLTAVFKLLLKLLFQSKVINRVALIGVLLLLALPAQALIISGLYDHELPVQSQSEAERLSAYREALAAVIVKVTGTETALDTALVQRAIRDAQSYVREVSYRTVSTPQPNTSLISIRFDPALVDSLLADAGVTVWDKNRPSILLWLSVQGLDGRREVLAADSEHPIIDLLQEYSRERGIPILIPLMDFEDRRNLPTDVAWSLDEDAIRKASARYGPDSILSGRVLNSPSGDFIGLWQFLFRDNAQVFDSFEEDLPSYTFGALDTVAQTLVQHFAIDRSTNAQTASVRMRIDDIDSASAHVALLNYIRDYAVVESAELALLDGASLELELKLLGSVFLFTEFLSLGRDLIPSAQMGTDSDSGQSILHYQWVR